MQTIKSKYPAYSGKYFKFLNSEAFIDCTLVADGHMMHAHKVVLAASSSYFEEIFNVIPEKSFPAIVLSDVPHAHLTMLIEFIYCGKVDVKSSELDKFLKVLKNLKIESMRGESKSIKKIEAQPSTSTANHNEPIVMIKEEIDDEDSSSYIIGVQADEDDEFLINTDGSDGDYQPPRKQSKTFGTSYEIKTRTIPLELPSARRRTRVEDVVKQDEAKMWFDLRPEICPFCNKKAKTNKHRNEHVKYCSDNPDRIVSKCPHCDKSFCDPYYIRKHIRTLHPEVAVQNSARQEMFHVQEGSFEGQVYENF